MKKYYCDKANPTRSWTLLFPESNRVIFDKGQFWFDTQAVTSGLVVAHRSFIGEASLKTLPQIADAQSHLVVLVISGNSQSEPPKELRHSRVYYRKAGVDEGFDHAFHSCLSEFTKELEKEAAAEYLVPKFEILDPLGVPDLLLAWVLSKSFSLEKSNLHFVPSEVGVAYNQLRASVLLRPEMKAVAVPEKCAEDAEPPLESAKRLIEVARVDL